MKEDRAALVSRVNMGLPISLISKLYKFEFSAVMINPYMRLNRMSSAALMKPVSVKHCTPSHSTHEGQPY